MTHPIAIVPEANAELKELGEHSVQEVLRRLARSLYPRGSREVIGGSGTYYELGVGDARILYRLGRGDLDPEYDVVVLGVVKGQLDQAALNNLAASRAQAEPELVPEADLVNAAAGMVAV